MNCKLFFKEDIYGFKIEGVYDIELFESDCLNFIENITIDQSKIDIIEKNLQISSSDENKNCLSSILTLKEFEYIFDIQDAVQSIKEELNCWKKKATNLVIIYFKK